MKYPVEDSRGKQLFSELEERMLQSRYDDDFLCKLIEYGQMYPEWEHFDIFYANYAVYYGNYDVALEHALKAYEKRRICDEIWKLLITCYRAIGQPEKALQFEAYRYRFYTAKLELSFPREKSWQYLRILSLYAGKGNYAPLSENRMFLDGNTLQAKRTTWGGEFIPMSADKEGYSYWVGVYNERGQRGAHASLLVRENQYDAFMNAGAVDFVFDIMRSSTGKELVVDPAEGTVILPIAAVNERQEVKFHSNQVEGDMCVGQWEYSFFRIDQKTHVSSKNEIPLIFGKPIPLGHSSKRRKLVLHVLLDALNWHYLSQQDFLYMPRMMEFFSKGVIFQQQFSVGEFTYPSLPSIETGMYPHHSQIFNERLVTPLAKKYSTLSERMGELGYYCVNVMGGGDAVYNGATRGYERLIVNSYDLASYAGVERAIRQMDAFSECDQFLLLHTMDAHAWTLEEFPIALGAQVKLPLSESLVRERASSSSVHLSKFSAYQESNHKAMEYLDRNLKKLFDYITAHYDEDEYIVQLYSDHGSSFYGGDTRILGDWQTQTAYMVRGRGVPSKGMVHELTSTLDIYPVLGKLAGFPVDSWVDGNLPAVFGGEERDCVYSESIFPGVPYELCIRSKEYEFYLKCREKTNEDGTIDLSGAKLSICTRDKERRTVEDPGVERYFLRKVKDFTSSFHHGGRQWRSMIEGRPQWYGSNEKGEEEQR